MKRYRLKAGSPDIQMVDGPLAGRKYVAGATYTEIPPMYSNLFEPVEPPAAAPQVSGQQAAEADAPAEAPKTETKGGGKQK